MKKRIFMLLIGCVFVLGAFVFAGAECDFIIPSPGPTETIAIIDGSTNMRAMTNGTTRFERAVEMVRELGQEVINEGYGISIILAGDNSSVNALRLDCVDLLNMALDENFEAGFGVADIEGALLLAEWITNHNPRARTILYSATHFESSQLQFFGGRAELINVAHDDAWNAAILDARAELYDGYFVFNAEVASFGRDIQLEVNFAIFGVNSDKSTISTSRTVTLVDGTSIILSIVDLNIYSFDSMTVFIDVEDSFPYDNVFYVFNQIETIRVLYVSPQHNIFVNSTLHTMRNIFQHRQNIEITQANLEDDIHLGGFDFYIFEHEMPAYLPQDGMVMLINPNAAPQGSGLVLDSIVEEAGSIVASQNNHPLLDNINYFNNLTVSRYTQVNSFARSEVLLKSERGSPLLLVRNERDSKIVVMPFSLSYSNLLILVDWSILMYNMFEYFFTPMIDRSVAMVGEEIRITSRGSSISILEQFNISESDLPHYLTFSKPGTYTLVQNLILSGRELVQRIFIRVSMCQSVW